MLEWALPIGFLLVLAVVVLIHFIVQEHKRWMNALTASVGNAFLNPEADRPNAATALAGSYLAVAPANDVEGQQQQQSAGPPPAYSSVASTVKNAEEGAADDGAGCNLETEV